MRGNPGTGGSGATRNKKVESIYSTSSHQSTPYNLTEQPRKKNTNITKYLALEPLALTYNL